MKSIPSICEEGGMKVILTSSEFSFYAALFY
jgi:hypothetical protein